MTPERKAEIREACDCWGPHIVVIIDELLATIDTLERQAAAEYRRGLDDAAKVATADSIKECPYTTDKKGDPTWNHTDEDVCPMCKVKGSESASKCVGTSKNRIVTAIRALTKETDNG